ncbi:MAG: ABC transporter permease [Caldilineaceae bacterium]|nr:ABC transporter permease [Caldilineaceae bacterium]
MGTLFAVPRLIGGLTFLTYRRLAGNPGLTLLALFQIVLTVGLLSSAGFFAQAVDRVILQEELDALSTRTGRPPFSTRVYFFPSSRKPMDLPAAERAGRSVAATLSSEIGLPIDEVGVQLESGSMMLLAPEGDQRYSGSSSFLTQVDLVYVADVAPELEFTSGAVWQDPAGSDPSTGTLPVLMHDNLAAEMGVLPGEKFRVAPTAALEGIELEIVGLWRAREPDDTFWFRPPDIAMKEALLVRRADYLQWVQPMVAGSSRFASWRISLDDSTLNPAYAAAYARGFEKGMSIIDKYLPGANLDVSPLDPLKDFVQRQTTLTVLLLSMNVPAIGFLLYFLVLISGIIARSQQRETSVLVSRGAGTVRVLWLVLVEEWLLILLGVPLGMGAGMLIARGMGYTDSFLDFIVRDPLPVSLQGVDVWLIAAALVLAFIARLFPAIVAARASIVEYETAYARPDRGPFWRRAYLDFLLVVPTVYAYQQLGQQEAFALLAQENASELYSDPLLVLAPALVILTASLLVMRFFSPLMNLLDKLASLLPGTVFHLALRQLGRQGHSYLNPLLLVIICLGLGIYTHSLAASVDEWLVDRIKYQAGGDFRFQPLTEGESGGGWTPELSWFAQKFDAQRAIRVGSYGARFEGLTSSTRRQAKRIMGVDRAEFASVSWFRPDFADDSLGGLMNRLAAAPEAVLVPRDFLQKQLLRIGDRLDVWVILEPGLTMRTDFYIGGVYDYFPTAEQDEIVLIANLDYLHLIGGAIYAYEVWLRAPNNSRGEELRRNLRIGGIETVRWHDVVGTLKMEKARLERVGVFGALTVGFLAAALMAVLAFLVHSYASLRERFYQFGVLRAIGALRRQLIIQLAVEYAVLVIYGTVAGAVIGVWVSVLFTPFFRSAADSKAILPPMLPVIAEGEITQLTIIFIAVMVLVIVAATAQATQRRIFEVMRVGQA